MILGSKLIEYLFDILEANEQQMSNEAVLLINVVAVIAGVLSVIGFFKSKEAQAIESITEQKAADAAQNQALSLLKQEVEFSKKEIDTLKGHTKELKGEIIEKVDKVNSKVDDLKYMLIELLAKQTLHNRQDKDNK
jgi:cell division protein FtsB